MKPRREVPAHQRLREAVEKWFITEPLLFSVWMVHRVVENPAIATMRVGLGRIEYNPEFVRSLSGPMLDEVLRLEAMRILLKHPYARRRQDPELAYLASNITLQECLDTRLALPRARDQFGTRDLDKQYFELYYDRLVEQRNAEQQQQEPKQQGQSPGQQGQPPQGQGQPPQGQGQPPQGQGRQRRSGRGPSNPQVDQHLDEGRSGAANAELWDTDELRSEEINDAIRDARRQGRWGSLSEEAQELILATLAPRLDYRRMLRQFRQSIICSRRDLTRMKPNRRYGFTYMGSRHAFSTRLLFAVDVSGSIRAEDLTNAYSVINQLFRYGIEALDVIQFDHRIHGPAETLRRKRRQVVVTGRGGTDFSLVMKYLDQHPDYDGVIVFTDGYAPVPQPPRNRRTRIFWLFNSEHTYRQMQEGLAALGKAAYLQSEPRRARRRPS